MITTTTSAKNANAITTDTISPGERRKVSLFGVPIMYTNVITNPYMLYNSVTVYMVHIPQYITQKVLSTGCILVSKQFENEISSLEYHARLQRSVS